MGIYTTSPLFLQYVFMYLLIRACKYISSVAKYYYNIMKVISCKADAFHCLYIATIPVHLMYNIANQVWAHDMYLSCVACAHWYKHACPKLHASVHVHTKSPSFTHIKHPCRHNLVEIKSQMMWFCSTRAMMWLDNCIISHWLFLYDTSFQS